MFCCHGRFLQTGAHEHNLLKISQNNFMAFRDMSIMLKFVFLSILSSEEHTVCQPGSHHNKHQQVRAVKFSFSRTTIHKIPTWLIIFSCPLVHQWRGFSPSKNCLIVWHKESYRNVRISRNTIKVKLTNIKNRIQGKRKWWISFIQLRKFK